MFNLAHMLKVRIKEALEKKAQLEEALESQPQDIQLASLGDRLGVFQNGQLINEVPLGLSPTRGGEETSATDPLGLYSTAIA